MIRLLICILSVFGLAFAPVTLSAPAMPPTDMAGCSMDGKMPPEHTRHSKVDCCAPACQMQTSAALLQNEVAAEPFDAALALLVSAPAKELVSLAYSGLDPPPRA